MKNLVITGAEGFIGMNMVEYIRRNHLDFNVIGIDFSENSSKEFIKEDLTTVPIERLVSKVVKASKGSSIDAIIHLAAYKDLTESYKDPITYYRNNINSTLKVIDLARLLNVKLILFSSSSAVYNDDLEGMVKEKHPHDGPSPYGYSKLVCERLLSDASKAYGIKTINFRYCNPIGGYSMLLDDSSSMFGNIFNSIRTGDKFFIYGDNYPTADGTPIRDYVSVFTIIKAHLYFINNPHLIKDSDVINIGSGIPRSCLECCKLVKEMYPGFKYDIGPARPGDAAGNCADITKLVSYGFIPEDGLIDTINTILGELNLMPND